MYVEPKHPESLAPVAAGSLPGCRQVTARRGPGGEVADGAWLARRWLVDDLRCDDQQEFAGLFFGDGGAEQLSDDGDGAEDRHALLGHDDLVLQQATQEGCLTGDQRDGGRDLAGRGVQHRLWRGGEEVGDFGYHRERDAAIGAYQRRDGEGDAVVHVF